MPFGVEPQQAAIHGIIADAHVEKAVLSHFQAIGRVIEVPEALRQLENMDVDFERGTLYRQSSLDPLFATTELPGAGSQQDGCQR